MNVSNHAAKIHEQLCGCHLRDMCIERISVEVLHAVHDAVHNGLVVIETWPILNEENRERLMATLREVMLR